MATFSRVDVSAARAAIRRGVDEGLADADLLNLPILSPLPIRTRKRHIRWVRRQAEVGALPPGVEPKPEYVPLFPDAETGVMSTAGHVLAAVAVLSVILVGRLSCEPARQFAERRLISHLYGAEQYRAGLRITGRVHRGKFNIPYKLSDGRLMPLWSSNVFRLSVPALAGAAMAAHLALCWLVWGGRDGRGGWRDIWERWRPPRGG